MEDTDDGSVEPEDPREWSSEKVSTFVRSLGAAQCFQSAGDQVLQLGVDDLENLKIDPLIIHLVTTHGTIQTLVVVIVGYDVLTVVVVGYEDS